VPISASAAHHRARLAHALMRGDDEAATAARRDLDEALLAERISLVLASPTSLTDEHRARLARLLVP
jgi:hypothetical protein